MIRFNFEIVISQLENGILIQMPKKQNDGLGAQMKDALREAMKIQNEDPLLSKLAPELYAEIDGPGHFLPVNPDLYFFKTWPEALHFLNTLEGC